MNDLTAIRDVLASQLATAADALESAQSKYGHLEQWTGSIRNRLETATMNLATATQEVDNLQAQIAKASPNNQRLQLLVHHNHLMRFKWLPKRLRERQVALRAWLETATPAAAGAPDGGDQPDAAETATGAPGVGDGPAETEQRPQQLEPQVGGMGQWLPKLRER